MRVELIYFFLATIDAIGTLVLSDFDPDCGPLRVTTINLKTLEF